MRFRDIPIGALFLGYSGHAIYIKGDADRITVVAILDNKAGGFVGKVSAVGDDPDTLKATSYKLLDFDVYNDNECIFRSDYAK